MIRRIINWFKPTPLSRKEQAQRALGLWMVERKGNATQYVSTKTGIPRDQVWDIILGKGI